MHYDFLIIGAGLYGAVFAHEARRQGKTVLVIDKRPHIAGNVYTERVEGINVHKYGAHIFHTNDRRVWEYVNQFAEFNRFTNSPVANYKGELYSMPFNMYTFNKMWGVVTPEEAAAKIAAQRGEIQGEPRNLEEQAISLVGRDIYEKLVKGYTEKQWGRSCKDLPSFIIRRLPVRLTFDNNYFNALYQGIPIGGYTKMVERMLEGVEVRLNTDYLAHKAELDALAEKVVYTGPIDAYFDYRLGALEYRSVRFETEVLDKPNFPGQRGGQLHRPGDAVDAHHRAQVVRVRQGRGRERPAKDGDLAGIQFGVEGRGRALLSGQRRKERGAVQPV